MLYLHKSLYCKTFSNQPDNKYFRMRYIKKSLLAALVVLYAASCVPAKHFQEMRDDKISAEQERDSLLIENKKLSVSLTELEARLKVLNQEIEELLRDSTDRALILRNMRRDLDRVNRQFSELQETQEAVLKGSARETTRLLQQLQETQEDLMTREDRLKDIEKDLLKKERALKVLSVDLESRNLRLNELEEMLARKDSVVNALHSTIALALRGFEGQGLSVYEKDGMVYVSLEEQLLFQTGSTIVDPEGVRALNDLALVLEKNPEIDIMIEGHTDDVPVNPNPRMRDNWDLSVLRATSIVRILLDGTSIDPTRLTVSGKGEYMPVDPGTTPEARRKNRRTEIILSPRLDELFRLLENN